MAIKSISQVSLFEAQRLNGLNADSRKGVNAWWLGHLFTNADVDQAMEEIAGVNDFPNLIGLIR